MKDDVGRLSPNDVDHHVCVTDIASDVLYEGFGNRCCLEVIGIARRIECIPGDLRAQPVQPERQP